MNELETLRKTIDTIDSHIIDLLSQRDITAQQIAEYKAQNGLPIYQPARENELLTRIKALSAAKNIDPAYISSLYNLIISHSKSTQDKLHHATIG